MRPALTAPMVSSARNCPGTESTCGAPSSSKHRSTRKIQRRNPSCCSHLGSKAPSASPAPHKGSSRNIASVTGTSGYRESDSSSRPALICREDSSKASSLGGPSARPWNVSANNNSVTSTAMLPQAGQTIASHKNRHATSERMAQVLGTQSSSKLNVWLRIFNNTSSNTSDETTPALPPHSRRRRMRPQSISCGHRSLGAAASFGGGAVTAPLPRRLLRTPGKVVRPGLSPGPAGGR
mmetsp:Transcript_89910/g.259124  ORF Transcript_89910/g.259124 Transcript_89910/m.259124 type:complete len:237 (-) Transcript_89910:1209-1919(-)